MQNFKGETAIVTGGADGIGKATCLLLAERGANVIIADIDETKGTNLEQEIIKKGGESTFYLGDMSQEQDIKKMIDFTKKKYNSIDILVNNIGIFNGVGIEGTEEEWINIFKVNVLSHVLCIKHCYKELSLSGKGAIVNVASTSGIVAQPQYLLYSTTKAALINMARCLALDLAEYNIRINNVCPGTVWTDSNAYYLKRDYGVDYDTANKHSEIGGKHPIGRVAKPEEIAQTICFLASTEASFVTGENLMVDGGYTIV